MGNPFETKYITKLNLTGDLTTPSPLQTPLHSRSVPLSRFLQLTSEGHNNDWQNYLRSQAGNTTTVNLVICTVDYLLRLQESMMDFYWYYSRKETIDAAGKDNFLKAIGVASQGRTDERGD